MSVLDQEYPRDVIYAVGQSPTDGPFDIPFPFHDDDTVSVFIGEVATSAFTIAKATEYGTEGNTVTLNAAVSNTTIRVSSDTEARRITGESFVQSELSNELDRLFALIQEDRAILGRVLRYPFSFGALNESEAPADAKVQIYDAEERRFVNGPTAGEISGAASSAAAASASAAAAASSEGNAATSASNAAASESSAESSASSASASAASASSSASAAAGSASAAAASETNASSSASSAATSETNAGNSASAAAASASSAATSESNAADSAASAAVSAADVVAANSVAARFEPQPTTNVADIDLVDETGVYRVSSSQTANVPLGMSGSGSAFDASLFVESVGGQISQTLIIGDGIILERVDDSGTAPLTATWKRRDTWRLNPGTWQKHLITADLQPRPEAVSAGEAARFQSVLDGIAARHPDLTHAHVLGDLVYEGSQGTTGAAPEYGFPEFLADWRSRLPVPLENSYFLPGNHDRDGTGAGSHQKAWSMQSYRSWIGPEYYYTLQGNLMFVYLGDMGGSTAGAITDAVVAWFDALVERHKDKVIFLCLHQPLSGTYLGKTEANDADAVQVGSARITAILDRVAADADNIAAVFFGHVGSANQFNDETWHGTRHFQIGMHIPSNVDNARNDQYYTMEMRHGAASVSLVQWDATADAKLSTKTIALPYPLNLAPKVTRHVEGPRTEPVRVAIPLDEHADSSGTIPEGTKIPLMDLRFEDRAQTANPNHVEAGLRFGWGLVNTGSEHDTATASPAHEDAGWITLARKNGAGSGSSPDLTWGFRAMDGGVLQECFWSDWQGLHVGHDGSGTGNPGNFTTHGATLSKFGFVSAYNPTGIAAYFGRGNDGDIAEWNKAGVRVGSVSISGSTTSYNTTSDKRLKTDLQDFDGLAVIRALEVFDHAWEAGGARSKGVMAQEAHKVAPYAVTVGGDDPTRDPWSVDYSKFVPDLIRAVQQLAARIEELEADK